MDICTSTREYMMVKVYYSPNCVGTILSPNNTVSESSGHFTSWRQTSHMDIGEGTVEFFDTSKPKHSVTIQCTKKNDLWYTCQQYMDIVQQASKTHINSMMVNSFIGRLNSITQYELWHQRLLHAGDQVMKNISHCVNGVPDNLKKHAFHS
mmetsp:Transcript_26897/g.61923  ORF Transcript_26897/g.61923 Transcript_26897/m.61923 type:complete len:151 (-) Transcript_26897:406-858(-)